MYKRALANATRLASTVFPVIMVRGPRQVGKSTLLQACAGQDSTKRHYVTLDAPLYFYRDTDQLEVDLLIESGDTLYPIEIKRTSMPTGHANKTRHQIIRGDRQVRQKPWPWRCHLPD